MNCAQLLGELWKQFESVFESNSVRTDCCKSQMESAGQDTSVGNLTYFPKM